MLKIAFYAPIKPPDHPIPSGDRVIAGNLMAALREDGHDVELVSRFVAYSKREATSILQVRKRDALIEAQRVLDHLKGVPPDLWMTYHPYCKAPDWIGPFVSRSLDIPYVTVEAAKTGQGLENGEDRWAAWRTEAQAGIRQAQLHLCFKPSDRAYLEHLLGEGARIEDIAPFIDTKVTTPLPDPDLPAHWRNDWPVLLAVGMMRPGKKLENYRLLSRALEPLQALHWTLCVVGDGPEMPRVREYFRGYAQERVQFSGAVDQSRVLALMQAADLFVWPGWREPIGMVYLEAQLMGTPVAAFQSLGVPLVVRHGETGLLAEEGDVAALSATLSQLISHPKLRFDLAERSSEYVQKNHSLTAASRQIGQALRNRLNVA